MDIMNTYLSESITSSNVMILNETPVKSEGRICTYPSRIHIVLDHLKKTGKEHNSSTFLFRNLCEAHILIAVKIHNK